MEEEWKDIRHFEGFYQVSNLGNVRSFIDNHWKKRDVPKILKLFKLTKGYLGVCLYDKKGSSKTYKVHRLVAQAFIPNPNNLPQVNHIDENKENNTVDNLEWCTCEQNLFHGTARERIFKTLEEKGIYKIIPIEQYDLEGTLIAVWKSATFASKTLKIDTSMILKRCKANINKPYKGFIWKFKSKNN